MYTMREEVQGPHELPENGLQASVFADEYLKWPGTPPSTRIDNIFEENIIEYYRKNVA